VIEDGVKLDNQIQVAHNCFHRARTPVIAGCVGIAGQRAHRPRLPDRRRGDDRRSHHDRGRLRESAPGTLVASSLTEAGSLHRFFPLMKNRDWEPPAAIIGNLDDLRDRLRQLESQLPARKAIMKMDIQEIMRKLPHRYPFILVDACSSSCPASASLRD